MSTALQQPRSLSPGDKLGTYELIRPIGVGDATEDYLARTTGAEGLETLVVVKRVLPVLAANARFLTSFLHAARLGATLHHANLARILDVGQDGLDSFVALEYIHGENLGHLVATASDAGVGLSLDVGLTLIVGLCAGLHAAHERTSPDGQPLRLVHGDLSPGKILVSYDGAVKLVDIGFPVVTAAPQAAPARVAYRSPEQCRSVPALDRRSDLFSVGAILYEVTTGRAPFTGGTAYEVTTQIVTRDVAPPAQVVPGYPPALEAIVLRALAREPAQRYRTAQELQDHLGAFAHANRLRLTPLVLSRLMGSLFPARLEEWDHAKAQGAFFVEQHVVRTLIESGKTGDDAPAYEPPPVDDAPTQVRASQAAAQRPTPMPLRVPTPMPLQLAGPYQSPAPGEYVADVTELVRPARALRALGARPDLAGARRSRVPLIAACVGVIGVAIGLGIATGSKHEDRPGDRATPPPAAVERSLNGGLTTPPPPASELPPLAPVPPASSDLAPAPRAPTLEAASTPAAPAAPALAADPEPPPPVTTKADPAPSGTATPRAIGKRPVARSTPARRLRGKPAKPAPARDEPEARDERDDAEAPTPGTWSADSPFLPVRPVKKKPL